MSDFVYRLQRLLEQKEEAKKEAEREATRREERHQAEVKELEERQKQRVRLVEMRAQLVRHLLAKPEDVELSALEVQRRTEFIKAMAGRIEDADNNIAAQRLVVEECERQVEQARQQAKEARREAEVLIKHRERQQERFLREERAKEELALDEIGNVLYTTRRARHEN